MSGGDALLTNAWVVRRDGSIEGPADIEIRAGRIAGISPADGDSGRRSADLPVTDCTGCYVSPGLVNLHTHSPMTVLRGLAEDVSIDDWFNARIFPYESRLTRDDVRVGALLAILEMVDSGVTAFFDHYFMAEEVVAAAKEAGVRADVAPTVFGTDGWKEALRDSLDLLERVNGEGGLVRIRLGPHAPYTCPPEVLRACAAAALDLGAGIHIHVSETKEQVEASLSSWGKTPFRVLYDAGVMEAECVFAHGTWMLPDDVPLIDRSSFLALAPKTYLKLASGARRMYETLEYLGYPDRKGALRAGIGTDGAASSNTLSPLEQARLLALLGKDRSGDATSFDLRTVWETLMVGHDALGQGTGDVAESRPADLVVWDLSLPHTCPASGRGLEPLAAIIYSADARNVRDVLVDGRFLKRDGRVLALDGRKVMEAAGRVRMRLAESGAGQARVKY